MIARKRTPLPWPVLRPSASWVIGWSPVQCGIQDRSVPIREDFCKCAAHQKSHKGTGETNQQDASVQVLVCHLPKPCPAEQHEHRSLDELILAKDHHSGVE